jgi:hypothetical protein
MSRRIRQVTSRPPQDENNPPKRSAKPSSEIDVDEVLRLAKEADEAAKDEPEPPKRRAKKEQPEAASVPFVQVQPDPEFVEMCKWGVGSVVGIAERRLDWSDPGIHWKEKVSTIIARIVTRIQPMEPSLLTDCIILGGYTALWAIPNVEATIQAKRAAKNSHALGNHGERKNLQDEGTTQPG